MKEEISKNHDFKKVIVFIILWITVVLAIFTIYPLGYPLFSHIFLSVNVPNAVLYENDTFYDIVIPKDTNVYFTDSIFYPNPFKENEKVYGFRDTYSGDIFIRNSGDDHMRSILIHELAHREWDTFLSDNMKRVQIETYNIVCESPEEFFSYNRQFDYIQFMEREEYEKRLTEEILLSLVERRDMQDNRR